MTATPSSAAPSSADTSSADASPAHRPATDRPTRVGTLASVSVQCADTNALADFYRELLGGTEFFRTPDDAVIVTDVGGVYLTAMRVDDYRRPTWPAPGEAGIIHIDIAVEELAGPVARAVALGAVEADNQPQPELFRVLLDPAGHPFCLTTARPE
ncbi:VOC family protein [Flexivirga sp. ID2601S]|uniref:VOC family protein n=1 Tax=Flexivirga aerilata TaxID=1656889 RepID=A0A849ANM0_9MICO|nr:VOC family protein [Flexivirga aerilata]NNG40908.1 VOC family protein [Flexivirga aerilata]